MFRLNCRAVFRLISELMECTIDNAFSLRDVVLQELVKIMVVCYIKDLRLRFKCGTLYNKCKAVPLQAWRGPEGSRKLRFPDFVTTAQDGGKVVSLTYRPPLPLGNALGTHFC